MPQAACWLAEALPFSGGHLFFSLVASYKEDYNEKENSFLCLAEGVARPPEAPETVESCLLRVKVVLLRVWGFGQNR